MIEPPAPRAAMPEDGPIPAPGPLPASSRMTLRENHFFVGREAELLALALALKAGGAGAMGPVAGITGLGGIGKTQLASEFALRYGCYFAGGVFWLSFAEAANVPSEVAACGGAGALALRPDFADLPQAEQVALVCRAWQEPTPRLLIFDNCEDEKLLHEWAPRPGSGSRVLLTSRRATWSHRVPVRTLALGTLPRADSVTLLARFRPDLEGDAALDAIAARLGNLPLALHLAGSYLKRYHYSQRLGNPTLYLEQLMRPDLLTHPSMEGRGSDWNPTDHEQGIARTFALSTAKLQRSRDFVDHLALALLHRAALFAPDEPIPRPLLVATLERPYTDEIEHENEDALLRLVALGLAESGIDGSLTLHRLLTLFAKESHVTPLLDAVEWVVDIEARRVNRKGYPAALNPLLPHLRHLTDAAHPRGDEMATFLCTNLGYFLYSQAEYGKARFYLERALTIREVLLGPNHPATATSLNNLGNLLTSQGEYPVAHLYLERAVSIHEQVLGPTHPDTAQSLNNLGLLLYSQGQIEMARSYFERTLTIREASLEPNHPATAQSLNNLGSLLHSQGESIVALPYLERALAIREKTLGPTHPDTATSLNNMGWLLYTQGAFEAAQLYLERALTIRKEVLGPTHRDTRFTSDNLATVLAKLGGADETG